MRSQNPKSNRRTHDAQLKAAVIARVPAAWVAAVALAHGQTLTPNALRTLSVNEKKSFYDTPSWLRRFAQRVHLVAFISRVIAA